MTTPLFNKLNIKGHRSILVLDAPESFEAEILKLDGVEVIRSIDSVAHIDFVIVFATTQDQVDNAGTRISPKLRGDAVVWFAYPKKQSTKYTCEFNRDTGWYGLGTLGLERVRQVAVDQDWSALRCRRPEYIKSMVRTFAVTEIGKEIAKNGKPDTCRTIETKLGPACVPRRS